jgi:hypothetical protein
MKRAGDQLAAIIRSTRTIDALYDWKGARKTLDQALSWPRLNALAADENNKAW